MSINRAILLGNVGRDPEVRAMPQSNDRVATFSLATTEHWRDRVTNEPRRATEWHTVVVHNQHLVGMIIDRVRAGAKVAVEGKIKTRRFEKDGVERRVTEIVVGRFDGTLTIEGEVSKPATPSETTTDQTDDIPY